ncbi:hypothetical protein POTOM_058152 [Populus tomentosa]|uniref:Uncharacterized protein n=1 Tax=Populus tomentosa TaxID=118781 RepID=A0A8X8C264_POPTO|nr:hypothetical protein POTOM_058152 [Populus tomentosa]
MRPLLEGMFEFFIFILTEGHDGPAMAMACHASGGLLATAGADRKVLVWDVDGGFCTHYFKGHKDVVTTLMFHPDTNKTLLFSGSADATVRVWDLLANKCFATLERHFSSLTSMAVSEDGWTLLTAGRGKVVNLWDLHDCVFKMTIPTYEVLEGLCVVKSGTELASFLGSCNLQSGKRRDRSSSIYFITVGERGIVRMWDSERAVCLYEQKSSDVTVSSDTDDSPRGFTAAVILPLDQGLLCVTVDHQFLFYSLVVHLEEKFKLMLSKRLVGYNEEILDMTFLGEEEKFLAVATNLEQVQVYDLESMSCSYVLAGHTEIVFDRTIKVWSTDGISDDADQPINLKSKAVVAAHDKDINSLAIAPNDTLVCSSSQWTVKTNEFIATYDQHEDKVWALAIGRKTEMFATGGGDAVVNLWYDSTASDKVDAFRKEVSMSNCFGVHFLCVLGKLERIVDPYQL